MILDDLGRQDELQRQVAAHRPQDARETAARDRMLRELARLPRALDETADPVHVTGSAVVIGRRGVLLHRHKRLGVWLQPGGHVDPGETPWEAAVRETREETGLGGRAAEGPGAIFHLDVHPGGRGHTHLDVRYLLLAGDADPVPAPGESPAVRWFGLSEACAVADAGLIGALRRTELRDHLQQLAHRS
jgi:8-oxo-dGTP pyrophosphatase MutT (NUDIX family)